MCFLKGIEIYLGKYNFQELLFYLVDNVNNNDPIHSQPIIWKNQ